MPEFMGITGPATAFVAGTITSLHCAAMCGPLACAVMPASRGAGDPHLVATTYHLSRLAAYAVLGALAGGCGSLPLAAVEASLWRWLPWLLVAFFVGLACRVDQRLPRVPGLGRLHGWLMQRFGRGSRVRTAAVIGLATPLLPCGPLYLLLGLALLAGSAARGAETLLAFGLGTVPLLWVAQLNFQLIRTRVGPVRLARWRTVLALAVAGVLAWRLRGTLGLGGPAAGGFVCF